MLIAVTGSSGADAITAPSGADPVVGIPTGDPNALLRAARQRPGRHSLVLCPRTGEEWAKRQAHVLIAADPTARTAVVAFDHHPLTLTLIAAAVSLQSPADADPGELVGMIQRSAARSRSLVWYPRAIGVPEAKLSGKQLMGSLFGSPGFFREIGPGDDLVPGRTGSPVAPTDEVYVAGDSPALLHQQLGATVRSVPIELEPQPWSSKAAVPITVLVGAQSAPPGRPCRVCGARQQADGCVFCGTRVPSSRLESAAVGVAATPAEVEK